jgi:hypothetical protein
MKRCKTDSFNTDIRIFKRKIYGSGVKGQNIANIWVTKKSSQFYKKLLSNMYMYKGTSPVLLANLLYVQKQTEQN